MYSDPRFAVDEVKYRRMINYEMYFMFVFPCIITLYYIKNQLDGALVVLFISHCKITLRVSDAFCIHRQEY
jgi:hypothetical protein